MIKGVKRISFLLFGTAFFIALFMRYTIPQQKVQRRPNFIIFLVNDMGWMDCTSYGSKYYETPNIDRLRKQGMLFTNAYVANPLCSPTRASLIKLIHLCCPQDF